MQSDPLFPLLAYIYDENGTYDEPLRLDTEAELNCGHFTVILHDAMCRKVKIVITDLGDSCVFHAKNGKIFFDGESEFPEGRDVHL